MLSADGGIEAREWRAAGLFSSRRTASETECEMKSRLSRLRMRDLSLFVAVAGIVTVAAVFAAREAGLGGGAVAESERLVLTLTPEADYCVTERAEEAWGYGSGGVRQSSGWIVAAQMAVQWSVSGGEPPYTLEIGGQSAVPAGETFSSASGRVTIPCADTSLSWRWGTYTEEGIRYYDSDPEVDSGWHTIEAAVKDANDKKATATAEFYLVYSTGSYMDLLSGGETYRVFGHLLTIPDGVDMRISDSSTGSNGSGIQTFRIEGKDPFVIIWLDARSFREVKREVPSNRSTGVSGSSSYSERELREFHSAFDAFADSVGKVPGQRTE